MTPEEMTRLAEMIDAALHREDCDRDCEPNAWLVAYTARVIMMAAPAIAADGQARIAVAAEARGLIHFAVDVAHGKV